MRKCDIKITRGYTSNELHSLIGDSFPNVRNRNFLKYGDDAGKEIPEFKPSKYYLSIQLHDDVSLCDDVLSYGPTTRQYFTCAISESNIKRAFVKRMLYGGKQGLKGHYFDPNAKCYKYQCRRFRQDIVKYLESEFIPKYITPLPPGLNFRSALCDWMEHCKRYTVKKKEALLELQEKLLLGNYEARYHGDNDPLGLRVINIFQKNENYPEIKEPRVISACSQECKALLGGFLHCIDKHAIATTPFFVKGMNPYAIDRKKDELSKRWSCFMGSDYSSYEGSQDYEWCNLIEKRIYKEWLLNYPEVYDILRHNYEDGHDIYYRGRYFGHLYGKRMSGDVQTSIGNGICNALIWNYVSYKMNVPIEILVEGDDAFICSDEILDVNIVKRLGFDCKIDGPSTRQEDICFLSRYVWEGHAFANIPKILDKIGVVKSSYFASHYKSNRCRKELSDYAYTKAYCYLYMFVGTPVIDPLCRCVMRNFSDGHFNINLMEDYYVSRLGDNIKIPNIKIEDCVRDRVSQLWPQFSVHFQKELEEEFNNCNYRCFEILDVL